MPRPELVAVASTPEAVIAAVQGGADAVSIVPIGIGENPPIQGAFTMQSFNTSVAYCRVRGIKAYLELRAFPSDDEFEIYERLIRLACRCGADAIAVADIGLGRLARQIAPDMPLHALGGMCIHDVSGVRFAAELGFSRLLLSSNLTEKQTAYILACRPKEMEIEVFVHGLTCMSYGGYCNLSQMLGKDGTSKFVCQQYCRRKYGYGSQANEYPLALKEVCLVDKLEELERLGVDAVRIEGAERRPEYIAATSGIYRRAMLGEGKVEDKDTLKLISEWNGLIKGMYCGEKGADTVGKPVDLSEEAEEYFKGVKYEYRHNERQCIEVKFYLLIRRNMPAMIAVQDNKGLTFREDGDIPAPVERGQATIAAQLRTQLYKLNGTPYICTGAKVHIDPNLLFTNEQVIELRDRVLERLAEERSTPKPIEEGGNYQQLRYPNENNKPVYTVSVKQVSQLSADMLAMKPEVLYIPLEEILAEPARVEPFIKSNDTQVAVKLPYVITDDITPKLKRQLEKVYSMGVRQALISHPAHMELASSCGFSELRADFSFNIRNSHTMRAVRQLGMLSGTVAFTLSAKQIRNISKAVPVEMIVYGRLPLMVTENCLIKNHSGRCNCEVACHLIDENADVYPVMRVYGCRNEVLSAKKLFLGDKLSRFHKLGIWAARLDFTTENPRECVQILERYIKGGGFEPNDFDRGLYFSESEIAERHKRKKRFRNALFD